MKQIINYENEFMITTLINDPEIPEKQITLGWEKAEFEAITGMSISDSVTSFSIEPHRNLYAIHYNHDDGHPIKDPTEDDVINEFYEARGLIRKHAHAKRLEEIDSDYNQFDYDPNTDTIKKTVNPRVTHIKAKRALGEMNHELFKVLYEALKDRTSLSASAKATLAKAKGFIDQIDWENLDG